MDTTAWQTYHRRSAALRDLVADLDATGADDLIWTGALAEAFADRAEVLVALHDQWLRRLGARVDLALELDEQPPREGVATAWREVAADLPGVRRVLDRHGDDPALRRAELREHRLLAVAAGLATLDDPLEHSARAGRVLVEQARAARVPAPRDGRLVDRLAARFGWVPESA
jgi:hypothetical protein